jgi:hypothetical protein
MIEYQIHGKCKTLADVPEGATITSINGRDVIGSCESCGKHLYESSKGVTQWADGVLTCKKCGDPDEDDYIAYGMKYHHPEVVR